jgi:CRP-like cAMP-binding protein
MSDALTNSSLPAIRWLSDLKQDDRDLFTSYGEFFPAHPNQPVINQGDEHQSLYFIISGEFAVRRTIDGQEQNINSLVAGDSFGEVAVFDPGPATASIVPREFGQVWRISRDQLSQYMEDNPVAANLILVQLLNSLSQRLRQISEHIIV